MARMARDRTLTPLQRWVVGAAGVAMPQVIPVGAAAAVVDQMVGAERVAWGRLARGMMGGAHRIGVGPVLRVVAVVVRAA